MKIPSKFTQQDLLKVIDVIFVARKSIIACNYPISYFDIYYLGAMTVPQINVYYSQIQYLFQSSLPDGVTYQVRTTAKQIWNKSYLTFV